MQDVERWPDIEIKLEEKRPARDAISLQIQKELRVVEKTPEEAIKCKLKTIYGNDRK